MGKSNEIKISSFFTEKHVLCHIEGVSRDESLRRMIGLLAAERTVANDVDALQGVIMREGLMSPNLIPGLAIPHTRLPELRGLTVAVVTSEKGIEFGRGPGDLAHVVILILTPVEQPGLYLQALASIAGLFAKQGTVEQAARLASAKEVWQYFETGEALPRYVMAKDIMATRYEFLRTTDYLERAIDIMCYHRLYDVPVVDDEGDLVGVMNEERLLKLALPEYALWMQDLSPILQFEPFAEILHNEKTLRVAEVMSNEFASVPEDAPAIAVARTIMRLDVRAVMVTRGKKLAGVITLADFLTKIFRK